MFTSRFPCLWLGCGAPLEVAVAEVPAQAAQDAAAEAVPAAGPDVPADQAAPAVAEPRRSARAKKAGRAKITCQRCRREFPRLGRHGPAPRYCPTCTKAVRRERDQARGEAADLARARAVIEQAEREGNPVNLWSNGDATP
jgi:type IV secretory pathway VirB10-like protein